MTVRKPFGDSMAAGDKKFPAAPLMMKSRDRIGLRSVSSHLLLDVSYISGMSDTGLAGLSFQF